MTRAEMRRRVSMSEYLDWTILYNKEQAEREEAANKGKR